MIVKAFVLLDSKTGIHSAPMFFRSEYDAFRAFAVAGRDRDSHVGRHPSDFVALAVGEFDDSAGVMLPAPARSLGTVASILAQVTDGEAKPLSLPL